MVDPSQRIVTCIPLTNLWDEKGQLNAHRVRRARRKEISQLLRIGSTFVVSDVGHPLRWIPEQDRFTFWKTEVRDRLAPVVEKARQMAAHASTRTTQLYDRREDRVTLDEVVKINIRG
jgi:hypothetical protein